MNKFLLLGMALCPAVVVQAQQARTVQGAVTSAENNETLPGVTVVVKGTNLGTTTDGQGRFSLPLPTSTTGGVTLRISSIGYVAQEVAVGATQTTIQVKLTPDNTNLDEVEVVSIGYGSVQRSELTGSVSSVSAKQIKDIPSNSSAEALTGRLAGVQITTAEGQPGSDFRIVVRGGTSITQDNAPLYVVDGVQVENALSVISPQDIASVDVLKDAASTAIYGARGANGVVIITTKKGFEGRTSVTYNGFGGVRKIVKTLDVLQPGEYLDFQYERAARNSGDLTTFKNAYGSRNFTGDTLARARQSPFTDWQREVFGRAALQQTHNVTVAGGSKGTTFSLSLTYNREQGIQLQSDYERMLLNFRFDHKASDKLRVGFNVRANDQSTIGAGTSSGGLGSSSRLRNSVQYRPFTNNLGTGVAVDPTEPDEQYYFLSGGSSGLVNPVVVAEAEYRNNKGRLANGSAYVNYNFTKTLSLRSTVGIDYLNSRGESFNNKNSSAARGYGGQPTAALNTGQQLTLNNSNVLTYANTWGKHHFDALVGHEVYYTQASTLNISTFYLPTDITPESAFSSFNQAQAPAGFIQPAPNTSENPNRLLSGFGRLNYSFDDKYLVTATFRADGSNKFKEGNRVGYFPAVSAAWRLSREEFMKSLTQVNDLKLRLSYGVAGNNRIANGLYDRAFSPNGIEYAENGGRIPGLASSVLPNSGLVWEKTLSRNLGLDLSLFDNRVQLTVDAYYNTTSDLLLPQPIPVYTGYQSQQRNIGETSNRGLEFQLTGTPVRSKEFTWTVTGNISFNRNKIESLGGQAYLPGINSGWTSDTGTDYWVAAGQPVGQMYGYITDYDNGRKGFYTVDDFNYTQAANGTWSYVLKGDVPSNSAVATPEPGQVKFKDTNDDGVVNTDDRTVIGDANPKFTGGLNQQFAYKGFDASIFVNFVYGNDIYNANRIEYTSAYLANQNALGIMRDRWRTIDAQGNLVTYPTGLAELNKDAQIWRPTRGRYLLHSWAIEDGSFLRINNVTLGYSLPKALLERVKIEQLRFYVTVNNLAVLTNYSGFDPEVNTRRSSPLTPGVDYAAYPRSRLFLFGLNLSL